MASPVKMGTPNAELPSYAFPFSPVETERGAVFEFRLDHVITVEDPLALIRVEFADLGASHDAEATRHMPCPVEERRAFWITLDLFF